MAAVSIGNQGWWENAKTNDPQGLANWILDALRKGGRLVENDSADPNQPQYSTYAQMYADLQATAPNISAMLPTPAMVTADPVNYAGVQGGDVFKTDEVGAATPVPSPASTGPTAPAPDPAADAAAQQRQQVFTNLSGILDSVGMGSLFSYQGGQPSGWLWEQIKAGTIQDASTLNVALESTPIWQSLFGNVINNQRAAAKADPTDVHIMSPLEIVQYRQTANQLARQYNAPANFYTDPHAWDAQMIGQVDSTELQERFAKGWNDVANADPTVRAAFQTYHGGPMGDQQLWSFFMDPTHSLNNLELAAQTAVIGGTGSRYGFGLQQPMAERIARLGVGQAQAEQSFGQLQQQQAYLRPDINEQGDLSNEAVANAFGVGTDQATLDLERRRAERMATTTAGTGGAIETRTGVAGVGPNR
jgi:hypothetical protein